jgi:hypothetical protein
MRKLITNFYETNIRSPAENFKKEVATLLSRLAGLALGLAGLLVLLVLLAPSGVRAIVSVAPVLGVALLAAAFFILKN